jgi:hypothetical protein
MYTYLNLYNNNMQSLNQKNYEQIIAVWQLQYMYIQYCQSSVIFFSIHIERVYIVVISQNTYIYI